MPASLSADQLQQVVEFLAALLFIACLLGMAPEPDEPRGPKR